MVGYQYSILTRQLFGISSLAEPSKIHLVYKTNINHLSAHNRNQRRLPVRLVVVLAAAAPFLSFFDFAVCVRVLLVAGELAVSASPSSASLSSASPASLSASSSPSSSSSASSICSSSVPTLADDGRSISTCSLVLRVPRVDALVGLPRRPRDGAGDERGSVNRVSFDLRTLHSHVSYHPYQRLYCPFWILDVQTSLGILIAPLQVVWQTSSRRIRLPVIRRGSILILRSRPRLGRLLSPPIINN